MKKYFFILLIVIAGCRDGEPDRPGKVYASDHSHTMATLYNHFAAEYRALAYQAFNIARERVDAIRRENPFAENLAIVVDIDETLIDNSPHQALMILHDSAYPYMWNEWCRLARASAVPGAVDFLQYADANGFGIFYVSNRKDKYVREATLHNLDSLGFPQIREEHFLLRPERSEAYPDPSDKQGRRDEIIARGYKIVLLIGDNLGDFYTDTLLGDDRSEQVNDLSEEFGRKFIVLPNAMYGNWPSSLGIRGGVEMDSLLKKGCQPY